MRLATIVALAVVFVPGRTGVATEMGAHGSFHLGLGRIGTWTIGRERVRPTAFMSGATSHYGEPSLLGSGDDAWLSTPRLSVDVGLSGFLTAGVAGGRTLLGEANRWVFGLRAGYWRSLGHGLEVWVPAGLALYRESRTNELIDRRETALMLSLEPTLMFSPTGHVRVYVSAVVEPMLVDAVTAASADVPRAQPLDVDVRRDEAGLSTGLIVSF